jgi:putative membrane protein
MRRVSIWAVALAATMTLACDRGDMNDNNTAEIGADRTANRPAGETAGGATADQSGNRDLGSASPMAKAVQGDSRDFVRKMGEVGVAEVKLGELAAERGMNAQVKQFGRRMVTEHQKANAELKQIASKMNVTLPAEPDQKHQELYERLSKLKGAEFDREYMNAMVEGHQEVARDLESHADTNARAGDRTVGTTGNASDADASVKAWASKTLPDVRQHLDQAKQIQSKLTSSGNNR